MNFMKMRTFYKKLPLFIKKNCPLLFIKNSMLQIVIYKRLNFWEEYTPLELLLRSIIKLECLDSSSENNLSLRQ